LPATAHAGAPPAPAPPDRVVVVSRATSSPGLGLHEIQKLCAAYDPAKVCWLVGKIDMPVPAGAPVQPRLHPVAADQLCSFLSRSKAVAA
jgi:hypothetical protein